MSIDNRDNSNLSLMPLMRAQMQREFELAHAWRPMPPPAPGNYLVTRLITDEARGVEMRSVGLCYFDGERWPRQGGYVKYVAWRVVPEPCHFAL